MPMLDVDRLSVRYGTKQIVDALSFSVSEGQWLMIAGPNGAGKSTALAAITQGTPYTGRVLFEGQNVRSMKPALRARAIGVLAQNHFVGYGFTVEEVVRLGRFAYAGGVFGRSREDDAGHVEQALTLTGLQDKRRQSVLTLSGGELQRTFLAQVLAQDPKLLLLDEPTVGVDPLSRRELWQILQQLVREEHLSVFVSTAYMEEAALCEMVYVLNRGRFLKVGTPQALRQIAAGTCYAVCPPAGMPLRSLQSRLLAEDGVLDAVPSGGVVRFTTRGEPQQLLVLARLGIGAEAVAPRLEDGFMTLLKEDAATDGKGDGLPETAANFGAGTFSAAPVSEAPVEIEVHDLVRKFGDFTAVAHTSFSVHRGEVFGLLGPNGAGKTTTFRMLCGLLPATSGRLSVAGVNLRTARIEARANVGYVAQKFSLYSSLSVYENLRFFGGAYGLSGHHLFERIEAVMAEFHLREVADQAAGSLPGGYKQRLSMAAALIHEPKILFLDEPTSGIDPLARRTFWREITALSERGTTIIITTHFMEEAEYCDRFMIQDHGRMLVLGSPAEIRQRMQLPDATMDDIFVAIVEQARGKASENKAKGAVS